MNPFLLLAQDATTIEKADQTVTVLERVINGGVPLICLAVAVIFMLAAVWQYRRNGKMYETNAALEREFRGKVEELLREMIEKGDDAHEVISNQTQATKDMTQGLQQLTTRIEYIERSISRPSGGGAA